MSAANPLWGAPRIHGELRMLGMQISQRTVSRLLARLGRPPSQTWRTLLANHLAAFASMDFFTVSTLTGRLLFVFVVLSHHRRRILHINCTACPTSTWTTQQLVEAFPDDTAPLPWLLRDRDNIYDGQVRRRIASLGITEVVSSPRSPWQNPYVERVIGSLRRECLNHVIVFNETHLRRRLPITIAAARILPWGKMHRIAERVHAGATSSGRRKWAACTTATIVRPRKGSTRRRPATSTLGVRELCLRHPSVAEKGIRIARETV